MKRLVEFSLDGGESILVEVEEPEVSDNDLDLVARPGELIDRTKQSFADAVEKIKPVATTIITKLRGISDPPNEVEVKFGVKMSAAAGAIIAAAGAEANYEITLKWKNSP
ncbi:hypothetical protein FNW02_37390 [Komarekiella sp. 'clone 1']|uniref:Trypsin-co-occurring domain-containing protein n=1 Tax=Komarekiella delphini-convector SJRDD-AB1 TaxID=2593771 RepID=A0AA40VVT2_9NOST|nr:hypothetical protein [Komarekiella delphini-convector SJRDD-AB1]MBW4688926.1 hypothetical protein [Komarekiella atlantica HA4396-MV6]